jgi:hypothetical protein
MLCGDKEEMWWLKGDVVAKRLCVDTEEMWWLKRRCGSSVGFVVTQKKYGG